MFYLLFSMAMAGEYQYVVSEKQNQDGRACEMITVEEKPRELCAVHPPRKIIQGDYNLCVFLVSCKDVD